MEIKYTLKFEKHGKIKDTGFIDYEIWIDVGNSLELGCFDHHQTDKYSSTLMAIVDNVQYLKKLKDIIVKGEGKEVIVHLHEEPDLDCIASLYAIKKFLDTSEAEFERLFGENGLARGLIKYVDEIDSGKGKITDYPTLYAVISSIDNKLEKSIETDKIVVNKGLQLLDLVIELLKEDPLIDLKTYNLSDLLYEDIKDVVEVINRDVYEQEKNENKISFEKIPLWTKDGEIEEVLAAIWEDVPKDALGYNFARTDGSILTVVPYCIKGKNGATTTRAVVSIDPEKNEKNYSLMSMVDVIEQMEQVEEQLLYEKSGYYRRNRSRPRDSEEHLEKKPFSVSLDPWYIKPNEDMFDAPRIYSILDYSVILEVIRNNGGTVKKSYILEITENDVNIVRFKDKEPLSSWQVDVHNILKNVSNHYVVFAEVDSSLICHSNKILELYCMNLVGKSYQDCQNGKIIFLDYRTCVYCDLNCTIVLVATYSENSYKELPISEVLNIDSTKSIKNSSFVEIVKNLYRQRIELLKYGKQLGNMQGRKKKELEMLYEKMLEYSIKAHKEAMISTHIEREIYTYISNKFEINDLFNAVMKEINILIDEARDKLVYKFNIISSFAVPFVLSATVFQMGVLKFDEIVSLSGSNAILGWIVVVMLNIIIILMILRTKGRGE